MDELNRFEHTLTVEARDSDGRLKDVRFITERGGKRTEFVPNRLYMYLLRRGVIESDTFKIPYLLGTRK